MRYRLPPVDSAREIDTSVVDVGASAHSTVVSTASVSSPHCSKGDSL